MFRALQIIVFILSSFASFTLIPPMTTTPHANAITKYHSTCEENGAAISPLSAIYTPQYGSFRNYGRDDYIMSCDNSLFFLKYDPSKTFREMKTDGWNIVGRESVTYSRKGTVDSPLTFIFNIVENSSGEKRRTITSSERSGSRVFYMTGEPNTSSYNESLWREAENTQPSLTRPVMRAFSTLFMAIAFYHLIMLMLDVVTYGWVQKNRLDLQPTLSTLRGQE